MGVVYEALDRDRNTRVALKTLLHMNADAVFRFKNEFRALQDVQHPNLVSLDELIEDEGHWFLTMELIDGIDFLEYVRPGVTPKDASLPAFAPTDRMPTGLLIEGRAASTPTSYDRPSPDSTWRSTIAVTTEPLYDEARLRAGLGQLARGLTALHASAKVHRDIKPSNVLVTRAGRVVLLDFGLVQNMEEWAAPLRSSSENQLVGTTAYMAPEQAASKPIGPAADWYAVGVVLYEALTGRLPFNGPSIEVLMNKQRFEPAPPRALIPAVPRDLDALCVELLRFEPAARPAARDVLRRLNVEEAFDSRGSPSVSSSHVQAPPFIGRAREMATLREGLSAVLDGAGVTLFVEGQSGVGKSALVRQFTRNLTVERPEAVLLPGRCYERESVPYKAFDGVVDALSRYMIEIGAKASGLIPQKAALLAQVFPVLRRVEAIAQAPLPRHEVLDPQELRTRVFAALRELLSRLAERHPVVVVIDDLQWADEDSLALMRELTRPPDPPVLLLVATLRDAAPPAGLLGDVRRLRVETLPAEQARELATVLIGRMSPTTAPSADSIAAESGGHPLFIDELVRHATMVGEAPGPLRLDEALWARISRLEPDVRRLLNLVAVAGAPLDLAAAARADAIDFAELSKRVSILRIANLVRTGGARGVDTIEPYHDWVRAAMLSHIDAATQRAGHERLAVALEAGANVDPESLMIHWRGAGVPEKAAKYAALAADEAASALAFDRAARLFRIALELVPASAPERRGLEARLGDALANAGRGAEAAEAYLRAVPGATAAEALDLQRRAAEQRLRSGHIDGGLAILRGVLTEVGMTLPRTPRSALTSLLLRRARIWIRGLRYKERDASQLSPEALTRIDVCWSAAQGLAMVDTIRGAGFQSQNLLLALDAGEPYRVARALAVEAAFLASEGGPARVRVERLLGVAEQLAQRIGHPHALGLVAMVAGNANYFRGEWASARTRCDQAETIFRDRCTNVSWEITTAHTFALWSLLWMGGVREFGRRVAVLVSEAQERGDLFATTALRTARAQYGYPAADDLAGGRLEVEDAMKRWSRDHGFQLPHWWELFALGNLDLYEGGDGAYRRISANWQSLDRSMLLRIQVLRLESLHARARAALAAVAARPAERAALLDEVQTIAAQLAREHMPWSDALAILLRAAVIHAEGRDEETVRTLEDAAVALDAADMKLFGAIARRHRGRILGGDEGAALVRAADAFMAAEKIVKPARMAAMLAPGFLE
jgi:serine/threonine protein kinase